MFVWTILLLSGILFGVGVVWASRRGLLLYLRVKLFPPSPPPVRRPPTGGGPDAKSQGLS